MSTRSTTTRRILREATDLSTSPSPDFHAAPLETNLHEWHFTLRGPPSPSPFASGLYHGRIVLPPTYPLRPPSFRFLTPSGRFEVNREICLSISGFHEESWQPAWGIRTALTAIRAFMESGGAGQVGGMEGSEVVRRRLAAESAGWKCAVCGRRNGEIMVENERLCREAGEEGKEEVVPEELRLGYREELGKSDGPAKEMGDTEGKDAEERESNPAVDKAAQVEDTVSQGAARKPQALPAQMQVRHPIQGQPAPPAEIRAPTTTVRQSTDTGWLDKAIIGVAGALAFMVFRYLFF